MGFVDPTTFVYRFNFYYYCSNGTKIIQYFVMHRLGLCIKLNNYFAHIFYELSHSTAVPINFN